MDSSSEFSFRKIYGILGALQQEKLWGVRATLSFCYGWWADASLYQVKGFIQQTIFECDHAPDLLGFNKQEIMPASKELCEFF